MNRTTRCVCLSLSVPSLISSFSLCSFLSVIELTFDPSIIEYNNYMTDFENCSSCKNIPKTLMVEKLHTPKRLPKEVSELSTIGGYATDGELRKCQHCLTYYIYHYDHDSESGVGNGYTDEGITRISNAEAKKMLPDLLKSAEASLDYWQKDLDRPASQQFIVSHQKEVTRLQKEIKILK
ncbi:MAG: hypothetical protein HOE90_07450 [Bacteriovoracaceae bacterium]|nr:hypothetical protein [Bacteriovoracaceae bacterium]